MSKDINEFFGEMAARYDEEHIGEVDQAVLKELLTLGPARVINVIPNFRLAFFFYLDKITETIIADNDPSSDAADDLLVNYALGFLNGIRFGRQSKARVFVQEPPTNPPPAPK